MRVEIMLEQQRVAVHNLNEHVESLSRVNDGTATIEEATCSLGNAKASQLIIQQLDSEIKRLLFGPV